MKTLRLTHSHMMYAVVQLSADLLKEALAKKW